MNTATQSRMTPLAVALGLDPNAPPSACINEILRLKAKAERLSGFVPRADVAAALDRAGAAERKLADIGTSDRVAIASVAIDRAVSEGKIALASKAHYLAVCRTEDGFEKFKAMVASLPARMDTAQNHGVATASRQTIDAAALAKAATDYQAEWAAKGVSIDITDAIAAIKADPARLSTLMTDLPELPAIDYTANGTPDEVTLAVEAHELQQRYAAAGQPLSLGAAIMMAAKARGARAA